MITEYPRRLGLTLVLIGLAGCSSAPSRPVPTWAASARSAAAPPCTLAAYGEPCFRPTFRPGTNPGPAPPTQSVTSLSSVAFTDSARGWAVGSTCGDVTCAIEFASTSDGGNSWRRPRAVGTVPSPSGGRQHVRVGIRFAGRDGWIFGPALFQTHNGGGTWRQTLAAPIVALEPFNNSAWVIEGCTTFPCRAALMMSNVGNDTWGAAPTQPPAMELLGGDAPASPGAVLERASGGVAFIAAGDAAGKQHLYTNMITERSWRRLPAPCGTIVSVRSVDGHHVWVLCSTPCCTGNYLKALFLSDDGGTTWVARALAGLDRSTTGSIPFYGSAEALVVTSSNIGVFGASGGAGIWRTADAGTAWRPVFTDDCIQGGNSVSKIWFSNALAGWAVAENSADAPCPTLLRSRNGGLTWTAIPSPFWISNPSY